MARPVGELLSFAAMARIMTAEGEPISEEMVRVIFKGAICKMRERLKRKGLKPEDCFSDRVEVA